MHQQDINGDELVYAKYWSKKRYEELIQKYREGGATDGQLIQAMLSSRELVDAVGSTPMRARRVRNKKPAAHSGNLFDAL
jgi:hypothetical protein